MNKDKQEAEENGSSELRRRKKVIKLRRLFRRVSFFVSSGPFL